jgi:hypothetical protein
MQEALSYCELWQEVLFIPQRVAVLQRRQTEGRWVTHGSA